MEAGSSGAEHVNRDRFLDVYKPNRTPHSSFPPPSNFSYPRPSQIMSATTELMSSFANTSSGKAAVLAKNANDVVIVAATRTALTKVRRLASSFCMIEHTSDVQLASSALA